METKKLLKLLCEAHGVSGREGGAAEIALGILKDFGECEISPLGSVVCRVRPAKDGEPHIMLDAHIDEIGLIVTAILNDGFIKVAACGGVDRRLLSACQMTIHGENPVKAVVCSVPPHLREDDGKKKVQKIEEFSLDAGLSQERARELVRVGDRVTPDVEFCELKNGLVSGRALDDRAGCAAVVLAAERLKKINPVCGISVVLSTQEEVGGCGAKTAAYSLNPSHAIAVDVSFGSAPGVPKHRTAALGSGPMIGIAPILSGEMGQALFECAKKNSIPHTPEPMGGRTGTNADEIAVSRGGVKTAMLSIPQRNMHSPVEVVAVADVENTARLIAEYIEQAF